MARGWSGAIIRPDGSTFVGPMTILDRRIWNLHELLWDLSHPGVCLVLGAGASHGVVPMTPKEIISIAHKMLQAQGFVQVLSSDEKKRLALYPEVEFLTRLLQNIPMGSWERCVLDALGQGQAVCILHQIFSPQDEIPFSLIKIYDVIENESGVIVSFNYDGIDERQTRFRAISPHGRRPELLCDPTFSQSIKRIIKNFPNISLDTDWHLPVAENEIVRERPGYQDMLTAWHEARTIVFIGYAFAGGADALSFEDFGKYANPEARVHVLCPYPDNKDLCKQIEFVLKGRKRGFKVLGQPFRWKAFAEAILEILGAIQARHICFAIGKESEIAMAHDRL